MTADRMIRRYNWLREAIESHFPDAVVLMRLRNYRSELALGLSFNIPTEEAFGRLQGDVEVHIKLPVKKRMLPQIIEALS